MTINEKRNGPGATPEAVYADQMNGREEHPQDTPGYGTPHPFTACPAWCDGAHEDYTDKATHPSGEALHWHTIRADHDRGLEYARIVQRNTWTRHASFTSTRPGRLQLRLTPHWTSADLAGPDGDELATTIARGRQLIARLEDGGAR